MTLPCSQRAKLENPWQSVFGSICEYPCPRLTCGVGCETAIVDRFLSEGRQWHLGHFDLLELPSGNPTDYARCQHQHSTATIPQIPFSFFYLLCLIFI